MLFLKNRIDQVLKEISMDGQAATGVKRQRFHGSNAGCSTIYPVANHSIDENNGEIP